MGLCHSKEYSESIERTRNIEKICARDFEANLNTLKVLLLGSGESGKSTVLKQLRMLYGQPYTEEEVKVFKKHIHANIVETIETMCVAVTEVFPSDPIQNTPEFRICCPKDITLSPYREIPPLTTENATAISSLWNTEVFQKIWDNRQQFHLIDYAKYFVEHIDTISKLSYVPTSDDILKVRLRTTGVKVEKLAINGKNFDIYDVGGQKNERKKWIHYFHNCHGVVFLSAINEYSMSLSEEKSINRLTDSIELFQNLCKDRSFQDCAKILFINKIDLLRERMKLTPIASVPQFSDYTTFKVKYMQYLKKNSITSSADRLSGNINQIQQFIQQFFDTTVSFATNNSVGFQAVNSGKASVEGVSSSLNNVSIQSDTPDFDEYECGIIYFLSKFLQNMDNRLELYYHVTCAMDSNSIRVVFDACQNVVVNSHLRQTGFLA